MDPTYNDSEIQWISKSTQIDLQVGPDLQIDTKK